MNAIAKAVTTREQHALNIFNRHVAAFFAGNLDAVLDDFGEDSVVITPDGVFEGREQIRSVYEGLLAEFGVIDRGDSPGIVVDTLLARDDTIFITWHAESKSLVFPFGTDTFICNGDRFTRQSIAFSPPIPKEANPHDR
ncbi:MAG: nuclear transport factor 2 family protein [Pseudomonadota bacterium]|nr:MAG: nuclear transport factor 2 family protein [Pseudomonadota bacterium]